MVTSGDHPMTRETPRSKQRPQLSLKNSTRLELLELFQNYSAIFHDLMVSLQIIHFKRLPLQTIHFGPHFRKPPPGCLKIGYTHQIVTLTKSTMITMIQHQAQCSGKSMAFHLWDPGQSAWPPQFMDDLRNGGCLKWGYPK